MTLGIVVFRIPKHVFRAGKWLFVCFVFLSLGVFAFRSRSTFDAASVLLWSNDNSSDRNWTVFSEQGQIGCIYRRSFLKYNYPERQHPLRNRLHFSTESIVTKRPDTRFLQPLGEVRDETWSEFVGCIFAFHWEDESAVRGRQAAASHNMPLQVVGVSRVVLAVPYWLLFAFLALPFLWRVRRSIRVRMLVRQRRCVKCGYDLRATPELSGLQLARCPECGAACKAANPAGESPAAGN